MSFTTQEVIDAGKVGIDYYLRNNPIDNVAIERPLLRWLQSSKKVAPGAKQYIVEQLRYRYQSNFQWFNGAQVVTYNRRQTIEQASFAWRAAHDGFALDEDRLAQNGIIVVDSNNDVNAGSSLSVNERGTTASDAEIIQLTNLIEEQSEVLRLGFEEQFGRALHLDGTQSADAITGLDALVATSPTSGSPGLIDRSLPQNAWWRNNAYTSLDSTFGGANNVLDNMETAWRYCLRNGGRPNKIIAGQTFIDTLRKYVLNNYGNGAQNFVADGNLAKGIGLGNDQMSFHGVAIEYSPEFDDLDDVYAPTPTWKKRCYFLNGKHIRLRPLDGHDMMTRKPPRAYDKYEYYWGLTWRGAVTMNRANAHAVLSLA